MSKPKVVDEKQFRDIVGTTLGQNLDRAVAVLNNFGPRLSYDVANTVLHATDKGKVEEVLDILEEHWKEHLELQHPDVRGLVETGGVNLTREMFARIFGQILDMPLQTVGA